MILSITPIGNPNLMFQSSSLNLVMRIKMVVNWRRSNKSSFKSDAYTTEAIAFVNKYWFKFKRNW